MIMPNYRIPWGFLCAGILLLIAFAAQITGPSLAMRLGAHFVRQPTAATANASDEPEEAVENDTESARLVGAISNLCEWGNQRWWMRLFDAVAVGALLLSAMVTLAATHVWIARGGMTEGKSEHPTEKPWP